MFTELYKYLLQHKKLSVPGIGTFLLQRHSALADFPARKMHAPYYSVSFEDEAGIPGTQFYQQLAPVLGGTEREAVIRFNDFIFSFKNNIDKGDQINWTGVGVIKKALNGGVQFSPAIPLIQEEPVTAEKVLRQKAEHTVRVGEEEKTAEEMTAYFNQPDEKKSYWGVWAAVLALAAFLFIGWHLSKHGVDALGNQQQLTPLEAPLATYSIVE